MWSLAFLLARPNLPTIHAFRIPLQGSVAFVFVNASDEPITFTAYLLNFTHCELCITPHTSRIKVTLGGMAT